ncbi:MAG: NUDIX domain-containing protein [Woeseiaceae bacterium]|nr:NUDIX domain-containing protein [Woeseiaceae bacterium]
MEELFDTYSEEGEPTGLVAREVVHRLGLWHRASNVFLFRPDGRLVVQRRHESKDVCPGAWDLSVAEHLRSGESFTDGATRGLREELGVSGVSLEPAGEVIQTRLEIPERNIKDYEFQCSFKGVSDAELKLQPIEVAEVQLFELDDLRLEMLNNPESFTPWFRSRAKDIGLFD